MGNKRIGGVAGKAKRSVHRFGSMAQRRAERIRSLEAKREQALKLNDKARVRELDAKIRKLRGGQGTIRNSDSTTRDYTARRRSGDLVQVVEVPDYGTPGQRRDDEPAVPDMTISVYLDSDDAVTAIRVLKATQRIAHELGYETPEITEVQRGSFLADFIAAWKGAKGQKVRADSVKKAKEIALEAEQYGRLLVQDKQADVDQKNVSSAVELISAAADAPRMATKIGAVMVLKYPGPDGEPVIVARTLSTREMAIYDRTPSLRSDPSKVEENLAILVAMEDDEDQGPLAIGQ